MELRDSSVGQCTVVSQGCKSRICPGSRVVRSHRPAPRAGFFSRRWRTILATAAAVGVMAYVVLLAVTPRYTGTAQVLFDPQKDKLFGAESIIPSLSSQFCQRR